VRTMRLAWVGMIRELLQGKNADEKAYIKSREIAKKNHIGEYIDSKYGITVEIQSLVKIERGIEIFAKAWRNGEPIGFGKDGTVEIEKFRIYNPPILVPDGTTRTEIEVDTGKEFQANNFKEDLIAAVQITLAHTIKVVAKDGSNIVKGKIGNTTSTFFPDYTKITKNLFLCLCHFS